LASASVEAFQRATRLINERGMRAFAEFCAPEVVCDMTQSGVPGMGVLQGREEAIDALIEWADAFDEFSLSYQEVVELGDDRIFALGEQHGRPRGGAEEVSLRFSQINEMPGGTVKRLTFFRDAEEGRRAAGLA
jgi:hypothetical protein